MVSVERATGSRDSWVIVKDRHFVGLGLSRKAAVLKCQKTIMGSPCASCPNLKTCPGAMP